MVNVDSMQMENQDYFSCKIQLSPTLKTHWDENSLFGVLMDRQICLNRAFLTLVLS